MKKIKELYHKYEELILYILAGVATTLACTVAAWLGKLVLDPEILWQNNVLSVLQWVVGVVTAFYLNRRYVFKSTNSNWGKELLEFVGGRVGTGILKLLLMALFVNVMHMGYWWAYILENVIEVILNYFLSKFWVFKKPKKEPDNADR